MKFAAVLVTTAAMCLTTEANPPLRKIEDKVRSLVNENQPCVVGINGGGSGVIISADGLVLTAAHVVMYRGNRCTIELPDGTRAQGTKLGMNSDRDAAMVRIDGDKTWPFAEVRFNPMEPGEWVVAMGHPQGFNVNRKPPVRFGRIIKPHRDRLGPLGFLMTDCTITGGDSGGPLFDLDGKVVGIHSFVSNGLFENYHVPMEVFQKDWDKMYFGDRWGDLSAMDTAPDNPAEIIEKPALGIRFAPTDDQSPVIDKVYDETPAAIAGLKPGDRIHQINDQKINAFPQVQEIIEKSKAGDEILLTIQRDDSETQIKVTLGKKPVFKTSPDWDGLLEDMEKGWSLNDDFVKGMEFAAGEAGRSTVAVFADTRRIALGIVLGADGYILTKASEVTDAKGLSVKLPDGQILAADVIQQVESLDIALMKVRTLDQKLTPISLAEALPENEVPVGGFVVTPTVTDEEILYLGVVSVDQRSIERDKGFLGVSLNMRTEKAVVSDLIDDCPAEKYGVRRGDIILEVNGDPVANSETAIELIGQYEPDELVSFKLQRDEDIISLDVRLGSRVNQMPIAFNMEGGRFSKVRAGFESVIQHDSPLTPEDCGGPLVNADGQLVGINIARSSRIRSFALPWTAIQPLLEQKDDGSWALRKPRKDIEKQLARARREAERTQLKIQELEKQLNSFDSE